MTNSDVSALIFPHTALRRSMLAGLFPWFAPLRLVEPPSFAHDSTPSALTEAGLVQVIRPPAPEEALGGDPKLGRLLRQWGDWVEQQRGSGQLETLKAGISPPPPPETVRGLMKEIRTLGQADSEKALSPPEIPAGFLLHLAHIKDEQAAEMEGILGQMQEVQERMRQVLGPAEEEERPEEYEQILSAELPPLDYRLFEDHLLSERLSAWAALAQGAGAKEGWLATISRPAADLLMERANRRFKPSVSESRSPAGAEEVMPSLPDLSRPGSPHAQEAFSLGLPDFSGLEPKALLDVNNRLQKGGDMAAWREGLREMLTRLAREPWTASLQEELAVSADELSRRAVNMAEEVGGFAGITTKTLGILAFPGLNRDRLLSLIKEDQPGDLPQAESLPPGSCPVIFVQ